MEKVLTSVNAIGRKEKSDTKLALEKQDEKEDTSTFVQGRTKEIISKMLSYKNS